MTLTKLGKHVNDNDNVKMAVAVKNLLISELVMVRFSFIKQNVNMVINGLQFCTVV